MTAEWRAVESLPASLHDVREPASSRSSTRTSRAPACVETGGQVSRHHNLLPSCPGRRSFCSPLSKGMIEYDDRDQIPAFLLPSSHSGRKSVAERRVFGIVRYWTIGSGCLPVAETPDQTGPCRPRFGQRQTAADGSTRRPAHTYEHGTSTSMERPRAPRQAGAILCPQFHPLMEAPA